MIELPSVSKAGKSDRDDYRMGKCTSQEEHEVQLTLLRAALIEGENSGPSEPFDFDTFIADEFGDDVSFA